MNVRRIAANEGSKLAELRLRALSSDPSSFASTHELEAAHAPEYWETRAAASANEARAAIFVADTDPWSAMVGVRPDGDEPTELRIWGMWVAPGARGSGVADELLHAARAFADSAGATALRLSVLSTNERAVALYRRHGFDVIRTEAFPDPTRPGTDFVMRTGLEQHAPSDRT